VTEVRVLRRKGEKEEEGDLSLVMVGLIRENVGCENDL